MSSQAEDVLFLSLTDTDSLEALATIGLPPEAIPTESMRPVVEWAIERFHESGRTRAPTRAALLETWSRVIDDARVELLPEDEDTDTVEWAIEALKSHHIEHRYQQFVLASAKEMAIAPVHDRVRLLSAAADELFNLSMSVQPRHMQAEMGATTVDTLRAYEARAREGHVFRGIQFGLGMEQVDEHTYGIHPGEVGVIAAGPKIGKSFFVDRVATQCWTGRFPLREFNPGEGAMDVALFTLENSVEMTKDRIVCMHLGIDYRRWQRGLALPDETDKVRWFINDVLPNQSTRFEIIMPEVGKRTMASMVRQAQMLGVKALFIDQLTFVEHPDPGRKARNEIIRDQMHSLKTLVSSGNTPLPVLMAHQINREGVKAARQAGYMLMEHLAEGSEVERTSDWVFGLSQTHDMRVVGEALLQVMASRREDLAAWSMTWRPSSGHIATNERVEIAA